VDEKDLAVDIEPILKRIVAGDRQAFADVVRHYQRPLFGFLGRMGLSQSHAEEIAQETFLRAWTHLAKYKPQLAGFSTWLFTIARNLAWDGLSRAAARRTSMTSEAMPELASEHPQPPEAALIAERKRHLHAALLKLPLAERSAIALAYIKGFELTEIARIEGCTTGAVKTRVHRAKQRLRQLLEHHDG
jgi:RNA polymerase sigma-70 factor, ECF subfamily